VILILHVQIHCIITACGTLFLITCNLVIKLPSSLVPRLGRIVFVLYVLVGHTISFTSGSFFQIFKDGKLSHFIDGRGATGSWMSYVNCARHVTEQNVTVVQEGNQIFYEVIYSIHLVNVLLVWKVLYILLRDSERLKISYS